MTTIIDKENIGKEKDETLGDSIRDLVRPGLGRGLDFVNLEELRKRTGVAREELVLPFALKEELCNSLDKDDASEIEIQVHDGGNSSSFDTLSVSDNGRKQLSEGDVLMILDFENKASSKRGLHEVSRGQLGNALKCILGYSYALAESRHLPPPEIIIVSGGMKYMIQFVPDRINGVIKHVMREEETSERGTRLTVCFPKAGDQQQQMKSSILDFIRAMHMVNPAGTIKYEIYGESGTLQAVEGVKSTPKRQTMISSYTYDEFQSLFEDYARVQRPLKLGDFISLFRGFSGKKAVREILQELATSTNHDSSGNSILQFFPATSLSQSTPLKDFPRALVERLYLAMRTSSYGSKPITKRSIPGVLGFVGEQTFEKIRAHNNWERLRYVIMSANKVECKGCANGTRPGCQSENHVEFPYLVEVAVFDRADSGGLKVFQCVNFMASTEDLLEKLYSVKYHLAIVGIREHTSVTVVVHVVSPVVKWLSYGKTEMGE